MNRQKRGCRHRPWVRINVARLALGVLIGVPVGSLCMLAGSTRVGASELSRSFASVPSGFRLHARTRVSLPLNGPPPFPGDGPDLPQWVHRGSRGGAGFSGSGLRTESTSASNNWSGIIDTGTTYTAVSGDWTVPWPYASASTAHVSTWIGISGISHTTLIQTGVAAEVTGDSLTYHPWYELLPARQIYFSEPVSHGDEMRALIKQEGPQSWYIALEDVTKGWVATGTVTYTASPANSAEWITERTTTGTTGSLFTLADYGSTTFHDLRLNGADLTASHITYMYMHSTTGSIISYPSTLRTDTYFTDTYGTPSTRVTPPTVSSISPTSGPSGGGTVVTITGSNFNGASYVHFGSAPAASFDVTSTTRITATSPAGTRPVYVTVTTHGGTSAVSNAAVFTYTLPTPTVSSISPTSGPSGGGTVVTITGSNFNGASAVNFGSSAAAAFRVTDPTQITATSPVHAAGPVYVTVTTSGGTSAPTNFGQFTYSMPLPTVRSLSRRTGPTAGGTVVTITGADFTGTSSVNFGTSSAATVQVTSPTRIIATSPAHSAGTVNVTVTTTGGQSAPSSNDMFHYLAPRVTSVSLHQGPTAGGTVVTITGADFVRSARVRFGTKAARRVTVVSPTRIIATSPTHTAGSVSVTVAIPGGTSAVSPADRFRYL